MPAEHHAPAFVDNVTGEFKGAVSKRGRFVARELQYVADTQWFGITAIAERYSRQSERRIELVLHRDIQPGTYPIENESTGPVVRAIYSEMQRSEFDHYLRTTVTQKGSLKLVISPDNNHYKVTLDLTVETHTGETLKLNIEGDAWLAFPLV